VVWGSKKRGCVATSTVQAEFVAATAAVKEATWLRGHHRVKGLGLRV
jgi:hypothetical protein